MSAEKGGHQRVHRRHEFLPGGIHIFLEPREIRFIGIFWIFDAALEFGKAGAHKFKFPVVIELYADLLLGKPSLQHNHSRCQILHFRRYAVQIRFPGVA
jgi:hypothetical protein